MSITIGFELSSTPIQRQEKGKSLLLLPDNYTVVDLETTGLDPRWDDIIEFGAIKVKDNEIVDRFTGLVNPGKKIPEFITVLTGITNEMLSSAQSIDYVLPRFLDFVGENIIVGHNVNFDVNFIYDKCSSTMKKAFRNDFIDTMRLSRRLFPQEKRHRLQDLVSRLCIDEPIEHRALADAVQTNKCYLSLKHYMADNNIDVGSLKPKKKKYSALSIQTKKTEFDEESPFYEMVFAFTGVLERMPRREAMQIVVDSGGQCSNGVTQNTNYLVLGNNDYCITIKDGKSTKQKKAEELKLKGNDIEIISEDVFYDMIVSSITEMQ